MQEYVLGFMFNDSRTEVALIRKVRPKWQGGLLNGIGGHLEDGEPPSQGMAREFFEETGFLTNHFQWGHYARLEGKDWRVYLFTKIGDTSLLRTTTDEEVKLVKIDDLGNYPMISNLSFLIPMALDYLNTGRFHSVVVE